jgi:hypothetical protein
MMLESMLQFANAKYLPRNMQLYLWECGESAVRKVLSKRIDLLDDISNLAVIDKDLIGDWSSVPRSNNEQISTAIENVVYGEDIMKLITQNLNASQVDLLAKKCTSLSIKSSYPGYYLYEKKKDLLSDKMRYNLIYNYVFSLEYSNEGPGKVFIELLENDIFAWKAVIDASTVKSISYLRSAQAFINYDSKIKKTFFDKIEDFLLATKKLEDRQIRNIYNILLDLSLNIDLDNRAYEKISELSKKLDKSLSITINENLEVTKTIKMSLCKDYRYPCKKINCVVNLKKIANHQGYLSIASKDLLLSILNHNHNLTLLEKTTLLRHLNPSNYENSINFLLEHMLYEKIGELLILTNKDFKYKEIFPLPVYLYILSKNPGTLINNLQSDFPVIYLEEIIYKIKPLNLILFNPLILGEFIKIVESLANEERNFALNLLDQWEGSLEELIKASKYL